MNGCWLLIGGSVLSISYLFFSFLFRYGAKVRGDVHTIKIGANTSIGDCVMVKVL